MTENINAYSWVWNSHCHKKQNVAILENLIEQFRLLINNKTGRTTCPSSKKISVIDFILSLV